MMTLKDMIDTERRESRENTAVLKIIILITCIIIHLLHKLQFQINIKQRHTYVSNPIINEINFKQHEKQYIKKTNKILI